MLQKLVILLLPVFFFSITSVAGDNDSIRSKPQHGISINSGYLSQTIRDEVMSPFTYKKAGMPININYRYSGTKNHQILSVQYYKLLLKPDIPDYTDSGLSHYVESRTIDARYSYLRKLQTYPKTEMSIYCGGELNAFLNLRDHFFTMNNNHLMVDFFNNLSFIAIFEKGFKDLSQVLYIDVAIPFLSYVLMRQTYNAYVGEKIETLDLGKNVLHQLIKDGDFVSVPTLFKIRTGITYQKYLGGHFGYKIKYSIDYYKFTQYDGLFYSKNLTSQMLVGLIFKFQNQ